MATATQVLLRPGDRLDPNGPVLDLEAIKRIAHTACADRWALGAVQESGLVPCDWEVDGELWPEGSWFVKVEDVALAKMVEEQVEPIAKSSSTVTLDVVDDVVAALRAVGVRGAEPARAAPSPRVPVEVAVAKAAALPADLARAYPINTKMLAQRSLMRVAKLGTADELAQVRAAVRVRYPDMQLVKAGAAAGVMATREDVVSLQDARVAAQAATPIGDLDLSGVRTLSEADALQLRKALDSGAVWDLDAGLDLRLRGELQQREAARAVAGFMGASLPGGVTPTPVQRQVTAMLAGFQ